MQILDFIPTVDEKWEAFTWHLGLYRSTEFKQILILLMQQPNIGEVIKWFD